MTLTIAGSFSAPNFAHKNCLHENCNGVSPHSKQS